MSYSSLEGVPVDARTPVVLGEPMRWRTRIVVAVAAALAVVVLAGVCSQRAGRWRATRISEVSLTEDPSRLTLGLATCNAEHRLRVEETRVAVSLFVEHRRPTSNDCADGIAVALRTSLGDRRVLEGGTNRVLLDPARTCAPDVDPAVLPEGAREVELDPFVGGLVHQTWVIDDGFLEVTIAVAPSAILIADREVTVQGNRGVLGHRVEDEAAAVRVVDWTAVASCGAVRVSVSSNVLNADELVAVADSIPLGP